MASYLCTVEPGGAILGGDGDTVSVVGTVDTTPVASDLMTVTVTCSKVRDLDPLGTKLAKATWIANRMVDIYVAAHPPPPPPPTVVDLSGTMTIVR